MSHTTTKTEFLESALKNPMVPVVREIFSDTDTPVGIYRKLLPEFADAFILESASADGIWARYSFIGADSFGTLSERGERATWVENPGHGLTAERLLPGGVEGHRPLEALELIYRRWGSDSPASLPPLLNGFVGFIAWEAVHEIFDFPADPAKDSGVPRQSLKFVSDLVIVDHHEGSVLLVTNVINDDSAGSPEAEWEAAQGRLDALQRTLAAPAASTQADFGEVRFAPERPIPAARFQEMVVKTKEFIANGEASQVVVSQPFRHECSASALDVYRVLRHKNPSPFLYLLNFEDSAGAPLSVVGSSPEALITIADRQVTTHPIAGSRGRGRNEEEDLTLEAELLADEKEISEHEMLVELARVDLAKVCDEESIEVKGYMRVEKFSHVMHIVSTVTGTLAADKNALSALRATFPAGTLSGSPKLRSLEIIDSLEPTARGVYGGVVGYFALNGSSDLAIAIRTATISNSVATVQAGAGIVAGSTPEGEDQETINKSAGPLRAIAQANEMIDVTKL